MKPASINRTRKVKILSQFLTGETALLRQLKSPLLRKQAFTKEEIQAMTDEQLEALIELRTGKPCPDYKAMTDEQLENIVKRYESQLS
ncbi:hypothetical protein [Spirosoma jeollabukense]